MHPIETDLTAAASGVSIPWGFSSEYADAETGLALRSIAWPCSCAAVAAEQGLPSHNPIKPRRGGGT